MAQIETKFNRGDTLYVIEAEYAELEPCPTCKGVLPTRLTDPHHWVVIGWFVVDKIDACIDAAGLRIDYSNVELEDSPWHSGESDYFASEAEAQAECDRRNKEGD